MQSLTSRSSTRRRFMRLAGTGATALLAATAVASAAGAATAPANAPGATGSVASLSGSSMEVQNASSGQTTVNWTPTTTFSKTVTEAVSAVDQRRLRHRQRDAVEEVQDDDRGAHHHREHGQLLGIVHGTTGRRLGRRRRRWRVPRRGRRRSPVVPVVPGPVRARRRDTSELRRGRLVQLPQGAGQPGHRLGQGDGRQRLHRHGVGHQHQPGPVRRRAKSTSKTKKPTHSRRPRRSRSPPRARPRSAPPRRRRRPTSPSVTASAPSARPRPTAR